MLTGRIEEPDSAVPRFRVLVPGSGGSGCPGSTRRENPGTPEPEPGTAEPRNENP